MRPHNENPLLGFNEASRLARCRVTLEYLDSSWKTCVWETLGLPERLGQAVGGYAGTNMTLKFFVPEPQKGKPTRFRRYRRPHA